MENVRSSTQLSVPGLVFNINIFSPVPNVPSFLPRTRPMPDPGPTPLQSFLGGVGLAFPVHALLSLNGRTLGISGFIQGAARGNLEDVLSALGMIAGGFAVGAIEGTKPIIQDSPMFPLILSGLLVGAGAKVRLKLSQIVIISHLSCPSRVDGQWLHFRVLIVPFCILVAIFTNPTFSRFSHRHMICGLSYFSIR